MAKFGKYGADGSVENEATECALTGATVNFDNSVRERIPGSSLFYRVINHQYERMTDGLRSELATEAKGQDKPAVVSRRGAEKNEVKE